jgi:hypothetical protein
MNTNSVQPKHTLFLIAMLILLATIACNRSDTLFIRKASSQTGITFNNRVVENDSINPIDLEFLYNGGGVAAADFNNDGMTDLYFTASTTSNKLYLNRGNFKFEDVTDAAGATGENRWANAASTVDINGDGLLDIYVANTIKSDANQRRDILYINQGINKDGVPLFKDMATEYGLADTSYSVQAAFFDYDNDGDLDMYLLTTRLARREGARFMNNNSRDTIKTDFDRLYRNDWNDSLQHPVFTNVSQQAGIAHPGFGLGLAVVDINKDGWKDVYVTNDFYGSDLMYINNKNGTFTNRLQEMFKHTSQNAMGNDVGDINNDGLADVIAVDMNPEDNFRKKKNMNGSNYNIYQNMVAQGYSIQYVRNTLQLNMGPAVHENDSTGNPVFADISFYAGVAETDWSWNPSLVDVDNDGWRDIIITNGYPRDVTDHDFAAFRGELGNIATKEQLIEKMPQIKIKNYAFRNTRNLKFENVTDAWGLTDLSFSNGAVYADLDNDGDLDYVINNINDEALVYENRLKQKAGNVAANLLSIRYKGSAQNTLGLGAVAEIFYNKNGYQVHENFPYRGYLSTVEPKSFFGLDSSTVVDSVRVTWPDRRQQVIRNVSAAKELVVDHANSAPANDSPRPQPPALFTDVTSAVGLDYIHREFDFIDFNDQRLLLHKLSQYGPGLAAGDIDANGYDDLYIGGTGNYLGRFFLQQGDGSFRMQNLPGKYWRDSVVSENMGILFFDADGDGDLDVYLANGSNEFKEQSRSYADLFLRNDGGGKMQWDTSAIPVNYSSKSCVKGADYDGDGDVDLFVGGRVKPGKYPQPVSSFIYRNDSENGAIRFTDVTAEVAATLVNIGMVCDGLWTDFDNDGSLDLVLAGEWMPITFLKNTNGRFKNVTASSGLSGKIGWWNSVTGGDFDNDGDIDYIAANLGTNSYLRASDKYPLTMYAYDFDNNNYVDLVPTIYLPDEKGRMQEYPAHTRDDVMEQLPALKKKFLTYKDFANANIKTIFETKLDSSMKLQANYMATSLLKNEGGGKFTVLELPALFQLAPIYSVVVEDFNHDGLLDVAATGNDFGNEVANGRYDALNGIVALGDGKGGFRVLSVAESGLFVPGDGKALVKLNSARGGYMLAASQNRGPLKLFKVKSDESTIRLLPSDRYLKVWVTGKKVRKEELYYGNSFLSQSSRIFVVHPNVDRVVAVDAKGNERNAFSR